jgi:hypothetical protein
MQLRLQPVLKILAALTVAISVGLLARQTTTLHDTPYAPCTIESLDAVLDGGEVAFSAGCTLRLSEPRVMTGDVVIRGNDSTLRSSGARMLIIEEDASLLMTGVTLTGTHLTAGDAVQGGAIYNAGHLELRGSRITRNALRHGDGAALYNAPGANLVLLNVLIDGNRTGDGAAGGLYNAGNAYIHGGIMRDNEATYAGAFYNAARADVMLTQAVMTSNKARYSGAIENAGAMRMVEGEITDNQAIARSGYGGYGAGLTNRGNAALEDVYISSNSGTDEGIAIDNSGTLTIHNSIIENNQCADTDCRATGILRYDGRVSAQRNYWGAASGPGEEGPGRGDGVVGLSEADYTPWLEDVPEWAK